MLQIEKKILNRLLDRYENSKLSRGENKKAIHITFSFRTDTLPAYFDESSYAADDINAAMQQLEREGLIQILWKNHKTGHIIEKVMLCEKAVPDVYVRLGRVPKTSAQERTLEQLLKLQKQLTGHITQAFLAEMISRIAEGRSVKEYLDIMDAGQIAKFISALNFVENNKEDMYIREFSIAHFHDSKQFENLIPKICRVIREHCEEFREYENEEILSEYLIYKAPGYVYVKGNARLLTSTGETINAGAFPDGLGFAIGHSEKQQVVIIPDASVKQIYTIENLTSFHRFFQENSLIIYLGGYHNSTRRQLLMDIYQKLPHARYYHFGDMDAGGFQIYYHLCEKTGIPFQTFQMDLETLKAYESYAKPLTENDRKRLKKLCDTRFSEEEKKLAEYMLDKGIKLEQECIRN